MGFEATGAGGGRGPGRWGECYLPYPSPDDKTKKAMTEDSIKLRGLTEGPSVWFTVIGKEFQDGLPMTVEVFLTEDAAKVLRDKLVESLEDSVCV